MHFDVRARVAVSLLIGSCIVAASPAARCDSSMVYERGDVRAQLDVFHPATGDWTMGGSVEVTGAMLSESLPKIGGLSIAGEGSMMLGYPGAWDFGFGMGPGFGIHRLGGVRFGAFTTIGVGTDRFKANDIGASGAVYASLAGTILLASDDQRSGIGVRVGGYARSESAANQEIRAEAWVGFGNLRVGVSRRTFSGEGVFSTESPHSTIWMYWLGGSFGEGGE